MPRLLSKPKNRSAIADAGEQAFAAASVDIRRPDDAGYVDAVLSAGLARGRDAAKWYSLIPEVSYAVDRTAKVGGYASINAYRRLASGAVGKMVTGGVEGKSADSFSSPMGGQRALVESFIQLMKIHGEAWLIRMRADPSDPSSDVVGYHWVATADLRKPGATDGSQLWTPSSRVGLRPGSELKWVTLAGDGSGGGELSRTVLAQDLLGRVWRPGVEQVERPRSPMLAINDHCEVLYLLTQGLKAKLASRLALAGILFLPNSLSDVRTARPGGKGAQLGENTVVDKFIRAATWAVQNHQSPEAVLPIIISGDPSAAEAIRHITLDRDILEVDIKLRADMVDRILAGLDVQPQAVRGAGDASHWGAWAGADDEQRVAVKPDIETMCYAATGLVLHRDMADAGLPPGRISSRTFWYDLSAASVKTNLAEDMRQLRDRMLVGDEAVRRSGGAAEADAPSNDEFIRMLGAKMQIPYWSIYGLPEAKDMEWDKVVPIAKSGPDASGVVDAKVGPGVGDPGSTNTKDRKNNDPAARKQ